MKPYEQQLCRVTDGVHAFLTKTFTHIDMHDPAMTPEEIARGPIMICCTHRSHADYFIIGNMVHRLGVKNLRFAAGDNLTNLPWLGAKYKGWGAFPVKRGAAADRNVIMGLCEDVAKMLGDHDNIIVFPEGGRSYKGPMLELQQVILGAGAVAQKRDPSKVVRILPCAVSYEQLPELSAFPFLDKGKKLRDPKNSFIKKILGNLFYFGADIAAFLIFWKSSKQYGNLYIDIGPLTPISHYANLDEGYNEKAANEFWAIRQPLKKIAAKLREDLLGLYRILPLHVVASALTKTGVCDIGVLTGAVDEIVTDQKEKKRNMRTLDRLSLAEIVSIGISQLEKMKGLRRSGNTVILRNQWIIDYYAGTIV